MPSLGRHLPLSALRGERHFRWRGGDVSRLEGLTDGVFALALTLLIVASEVPASYTELLTTFRQLPAFAACFAMFALLWYAHYQYHRRFGLENALSVALNFAFLFLILFYVYPAKFLFTALFEGLFTGRPPQLGPEVMLWYGGGVVSLFTLLALMNAHAYRQREALELDAVERLLTRTAIREHLIHVAIALLSIVLALRTHLALAGFVYFLEAPLQALNGWRTGRAIRAGRVTA